MCVFGDFFYLCWFYGGLKDVFKNHSVALCQHLKRLSSDSPTPTLQPSHTACISRFMQNWCPGTQREVCETVWTMSTLVSPRTLLLSSLGQFPYSDRHYRNHKFQYLPD